MGEWQLHIIRKPNLMLSALPNCDTAPRPGTFQTWCQPHSLRVSLGPSGALWTMPKKSSHSRKMSKSPVPFEGSHPKYTGWLWKVPHPATTLETSVSVMWELLPEGTVGAVRVQTRQVNRLLSSAALLPMNTSGGRVQPDPTHISQRPLPIQ